MWVTAVPDPDDPSPKSQSTELTPDQTSRALTEKASDCPAPPSGTDTSLQHRPGRVEARHLDVGGEVVVPGRKAVALGVHRDLRSAQCLALCEQLVRPVRALRRAADRRMDLVGPVAAVEGEDGAAVGRRGDVRVEHLSAGRDQLRPIQGGPFAGSTLAKICDDRSVAVGAWSQAAVNLPEPSTPTAGSAADCGCSERIWVSPNDVPGPLSLAASVVPVVPTMGAASIRPWCGRPERPPGAR